MKKTMLILWISLLNLNLNFAQTRLKKQSMLKEKEVEIRIKTDKKKYQIGDTIRMKIQFKNNTKNDFSIAFRKGSFHFKQLILSQNEKKLSQAGICFEKSAPLGFFESDYHKLKSNSKLDFELKLEIINFPINRNCFEEQFYKSGYGIVCERQGALFEKLDELKMVFNYNVHFPNSPNESIHSAYYTKKNVWNQALISNILKIKIRE